MLMASIKGKLTLEQENMEDILTSNVFGGLRYAPYCAVRKILAEAVTEDQQKLDIKPITGISWEFWPYLAREGCIPCEPDVLLRIKHSDKTETAVMVEAKYRSGKSSTADYTRPELTDQLAREWSSLVRLQESSVEAVLLYLTADISYPNDCMQEAQAELKEKGWGRGRFAWLSWQAIHRCCSHSQVLVLRDIAVLLSRLRLIDFRGITLDQAANSRLPWAFARTATAPWQLDCGEPKGYVDRDRK